MRILHTSDWHLGRRFGNHRLLDVQADFLDWLVQVAESEAIDLVLVSGDLYDRAVPPAEAVELFGETMSRLVSSGVDVAAIAGNHDSAERIGSVDGQLAQGQIRRGGYRRADLVETLHYDDGPLAVVAVPYLDPVMLPASDSQTGGATHESVLSRVLGRARQNIGGRRSVVLAHAFVTNAEPSDSERCLAVGDAAMVSSSVFAGFDYVGLGHLHRPQIIGGDERVRYSGAPLPYSFGETVDKEVVLVELDADGDARSKPIPVDVGRSVVTVKGTLDQVLARDSNRTDWVRVELADPHPIPDAQRRLRDHFRYLVETVRAAPVGAAPAALSSRAARERSPLELGREFLDAVAPDTDPGDHDLVAATLTDPSLRS